MTILQQMRSDKILEALPISSQLLQSHKNNFRSFFTALIFADHKARCGNKNNVCSRICIHFSIVLKLYSKSRASEFTESGDPTGCQRLREELNTIVVPQIL